MKRRLFKLLAAAERGEQFVIARRGVPVARLVSAVPMTTRRSRSSSQPQWVTLAMEALANLRQGITLEMQHHEAIEAGARRPKGHATAACGPVWWAWLGWLR